MQFSPYVRMVPGADKAVLFVHGIVGTPAHFAPLIPLVPENVSVCNLLLDGHGGSVRDFSRTSMKKWRSQITAQVEALLVSHSTVFIAAHSMGTFFAMEQALSHPDRIGGLFLLAVPLTPRVRPSAMVHSLQAALGFVKPGSPAETMAADCGVRLTPWLHQYLGWIPRYWELLKLCREARAFLPAISVPCRCFQSRRDELVSPRALRLLREHPHLNPSELPDSGHFAYAPEDLKVLRSALAEMLRFWGS